MLFYILVFFLQDFHINRSVLYRLHLVKLHLQFFLTFPGYDCGMENVEPLNEDKWIIISSCFDDNGYRPDVDIICMLRAYQ